MLNCLYIIGARRPFDKAYRDGKVEQGAKTLREASHFTLETLLLEKC
jgi:hypothetical protein